MSEAAQPPALQNLSLDEKTTPHDDSGYATPTTTKSASGGPIRTPFEHSPPDCHPVERPALTAEQQEKYTKLLSAVEAWEKLPSSTAKDATQEPLDDTERQWLSRECLLRYLRATKWDQVQAAKRLQDTLVWRREFKADQITAEQVSIESETGKQFILGYDKSARPCLYMAPGRQNTKKSDRQIEHVVYMLDRVIDMMEPGQDMLCLLINFRNATSGGSPSMSQGRQVLTILQNHYPERLGKACVSELPWFISTFFKMITPFIDPATREKIAFNEDLKKYVPAQQLDKNYGGTANFEYEHDKYWPALTKVCEEKRAANTKRWEDAGKRIGEYEAYIRGGEQKPLKEVEVAESQAPAAEDPAPAA